MESFKDDQKENQNLPTRTVSTRLTSGQFTLVSEYCKRVKSKPSVLIKDLLLEEINPDGISAPANVAGQNVFEYDKKRDAFLWIIELDDGKRIDVLKNISPEYLKQLYNSAFGALTVRDDLHGKKKLSSVAIPRKLLKGKK
jgi:hypothetical protein